jgi:leucyl aminopeptidase (aminopeptidase T)
MSKEFQEAARVAVVDCAAVKPSDSVLVITDTKLQRVGNALFEAALEQTDNAAIITILPRKSHAEEPPEAVAELMKHYDVLFIPTWRSMSHTDARRNACKLGARCATLPCILEETFQRALKADYERIAALSSKMADLISNASEARVTTPAGTDLTFSLEGRKGLADTGLIRNPGTFTNLPAGEAYAAPVEGTSNGVVVIDGAIADTGILSPSDFIRVEVANGYATKITGGKSAEYLLSIIESHGKEARNVAELGIGTNHEAKLIGSILEDEKVLGTVHIAFGDNKSMGGNISVGSHLDAILLKPSLYFDGASVMLDGEIVVK